MREKRITAIIMSVFMVLSLLPSTVFAAAAATLEGQLKISGTAAVGSTLSADLKEVKPDGLAEDSISYVWSRKTDDDKELKELSKEKTYTVVQEDVGNKIVLTITGMEDKGFSGSLKAVTDYVLTAEEAASREQEENTEENQAEVSGEEQQETVQEEADGEESGEASSEEVTEESVPEDTYNEEISGEEYTELETSEEEYTEDPSEQYIENTESGTLPSGNGETETYGETQDAAGTESIGGIPVATEEGSYMEETMDDAGDQAYDESSEGNSGEFTLTETYEESADTAASADDPGLEENEIPSGGSEENSEEISYQAEVTVDDGTDAVDFGTVVSGEEEDNEGKYVTVTNTGTGELNFVGISPEHFVVQDITEPLQPGESVTLWIGPRAGTAPGTYEDTVTYTSEEGAEASFTAKMVLEEKITNVLSADQDALNFTSADGQKVTVTNQGNQEITLQASATAGTVEVVPSDPVTLAAGASFEFSVNPVPDNLEQGKEYDDTITFADVSNGENKVAVAVKTVLPTSAPQPTSTPLPTATPQPTSTPEPEKVSQVTSDSTELDFGTAVEGYTESPASKSATLTNSGTGDAELSYSVSGKNEAQYFDVVLQDEKVGAQGGTTSFIVRPKNGLTAGTYEESFIINDNTAGTEIVITARFTVEAAVHKLSVSADSLEFSSMKEGYSEIEAQQFTVTNDGNMAETLTQPSGNNFEISKVEESSLTLQPGDSVSFTVRPKSGLGEGTYEETVRIASADAETSISLGFQVIKGTATVTKIQQPSSVTGLPNGTKKDAQSLKLPSAVVIETTAGNMKAAVAWDVENCNYSASSTEAQTFRIRGAVTLPDGVDNNNNLTLTTYIQVSVNAYSPKTVSADGNYITGIEYNGVYTTQSRISFTAVGAGMDNTSPRKGDTRYVPLNWTVINTNTWTGSPYTASFGMAQSGDYTLKVTFKLQQYNGSSWTDADKYDTKQVPFTISKAKVMAPGLDLTPAANRRNAVQTGDNTPIVPFVIILVAAVAVIGGILVYRRKGK